MDRNVNPAARKIGSVCVFCGSNNGRRPEYADAAESLGREIVRRGQRLVYGGGDVGVMGVLARAVLESGGEVTGVIPRRLYEIVDHVELTELVIAADMHERKARMYEASDAFIAMPGGIGTLDELFEVWTWRQIGYHDKPVGVFEVEGFFAPLLSFIEHMSSEGFLSHELVDDLVVRNDAASLLDALAAQGSLSKLKRPEPSRRK